MKRRLLLSRCHRAKRRLVVISRLGGAFRFFAIFALERNAVERFKRGVLNWES